MPPVYLKQMMQWFEATNLPWSGLANGEPREMAGLPKIGQKIGQK